MNNRSFAVKTTGVLCAFRHDISYEPFIDLGFVLKEVRRPNGR